MTESYKNKTDRDLLIEIHTNQKSLHSMVKDHEERIRKGEKWRYLVMGGGLLSGGSVAAILSKISNVFHGG